MSLTVQLRVSIALRKLNCVQHVMTLNVPSYNDTQVYSIFLQVLKTHTAFRVLHFFLVMAMQQHFQVTRFYILDFYHRSNQDDTISSNGWLLLKD
jgi:hypothetical protein